MENSQIIEEIRENGTLSQSTVRSIGEFDKASRYYIKPAYQTESSTSIRTPSRAWPYSMYKHAFTAKYAKQLLQKLEEKEQQ